MGGADVTESIHSLEGECYDKNIQKMKKRGKTRCSSLMICR